MVKLVRKQEEGSSVRLEFEELVSVCPLRGDKDRTDFQLDYVPGESDTRIDLEKLQKYLASLERTMKKEEGILMEVIPMRILEYCIEDCVNRGRNRYAAPKKMEIRSSSRSLEPETGKDWGIKANVEFDRDVVQV